MQEVTQADAKELAYANEIDECLDVLYVEIRHQNLHPNIFRILVVLVTNG